MSGMSVEVRGIERLQRKLGNALGPVRHLMEQTVEYVEDETREGAKPHPGDVGTLGRGRNVQTSLAPDPVPLHAKVFTRSPIVRQVDQGRPAGRMPPITPIGRWAERHGISVRRAFYIARSIGRRGSRPVRFFKAAAEAGKRKLPQFIRETAGRIERDWGR